MPAKASVQATPWQRVNMLAPHKKPELLFPSIANIVTSAVLFARANPDDGDTDDPDKDLPAMSINMTILLTLIVSFSIALAGVVHI